MNEISPHKINLIKGIGIYCIVLGHCCNQANAFVYLFHLPLFFFLSGYLYSEEKYGHDWLKFAAKRLRRLWIPYVLLESFWTLTHNLLAAHLFLYTNEPYSGKEILQRLLLNLIGCGSEEYGGPLWFLPVLAMAALLFALIISLSLLLEEKWGTVAKYGFQTAVFLGLGAWGYYLETNDIHTIGGFYIVPFVTPFLWAGYLCRRYQPRLNRQWHGILGAAAVLAVGWASQNWQLEMVYEIIYPGAYPVALLGIVAVFLIGDFLEGVTYSWPVTTLAGRASFWIMVLHFPMIRVMDHYLEKSGYVSSTPTLVAAKCPELWYAYLLVSVGTSLLFYLVWQQIKGRRTER